MKKAIKILIGFVTGVAVAVITIQGLSYILIDNSQAYTRLTFHELYEQQENIDTLFVGSSHCFRAIDPHIMDEKTGENTFNGGTSCQYLDGSDVIIRETDKDNKLKKVYVEMYYGQIGFNPGNRGNTTATYIISDYMKPSLNKLEYLLQATESKNYANSVLPLRREINKFFDYDYILSVIQNKSTEQYKNYNYITKDNEFYQGKGFVYSEYSVPKNTYGHLNGFAKVNVMSEYDINNMQRIIDYCKMNEIELVFFSTPMSDFRLISLGNYDSYVQEISNFCEKNDVEYWDFNLCKREYLNLDESSFIDDNHLNGKGAETFSLLLAKLDKGILKAEEVFLNTYKEKVLVDKDIVYGTILHQDAGGYRIETVKSEYKGILYYSVYKEVNGESIVLQEKSENTFLSLPEDEHGSMRIVTSDEKGIELNNTIINY